MPETPNVVTAAEQATKVGWYVEMDCCTPWSRSDDDRFRAMIEQGRSPEEIASALGKSHQQLRQRGYLLGLPLKWFKKKRRKVLSAQ